MSVIYIVQSDGYGPSDGRHYNYSGGGRHHKPEETTTTERLIVMTNFDSMEYQARQKSLGIAYALWFFLAMFGAHRFYAGDRTGTAVAQLVCTVLIVGIPVTAVWVIVDAFLIPGWIREHNMRLVHELQERHEQNTIQGQFRRMEIPENEV